MRPTRFRRSVTSAPAFLLIAAVLLILPGSAKAQGTATLEGRVRTDDGRTIPSGVQIRVEKLDGELAAALPPSSDGQFEISGLPKVVMHVIVTAEGFQTYQESIDLGRAASRIMVNIYLTPAGRTKPPAPELTARTDANASKNARKEYERGARAMEKKNLPEAQKYLERAVTEYPCYARAQADLGLVFSAKKEPAPAVAALRKAIECDPDYLAPYGLLGEIYNAERKFGEGEKVLLEGLRRSPNTWQFRYHLGSAHQGLGQFETAEGDYQKALSLNSNPPPQIYVKLADLYTKSNAYDKAYAQMQAYLRAEPDGRFAARIKSIMHEMESSGVLRAAQSGAPPSPPPKP
jgi:tetratricopeptide (TPR) repeat protein